MGSGASWGEVVLDDKSDIWVALSDIKDYFYAPGIPETFGDQFCLPDLPVRLARELSGADLALRDLGDGSLGAPFFHGAPDGVSVGAFSGP
eukprot:8176748-Lingulodinium_polyedra.AAC.1